MEPDAIFAARDRLAQHARRTPLLESPFLNEIAGRRVLIKAECLQHTGSFKFRGAWSALTALPAEKRAQGVCAVSSGNHAQGVAMAAQMIGVPATIVMPADAPRLKIENTRAYGAEVVLYDRATVDRDALVRQVADERGQHVILPFDDADVIAGQGTVGLEIAEQASEMGITRAHVLVCCGGGGLTAGIATALHATALDMRVHPVEPERFDDVARSLSTGTRQMNSVRSGSICDAILTPESGDLTWPIIRDLCGAGAVVSDDMALDAVAAAFQRLKLVVEPGGAVALAAALWALPDGVAADVPVIAVATGGNVDADIFARALARL